MSLDALTPTERVVSAALNAGERLTPESMKQVFGWLSDARNEVADLQVQVELKDEAFRWAQQRAMEAETQVKRLKEELLATEVPPGCSHRTKRRYRCYDCDRTFCKRCIKAHCAT